MGMTNTQFKAHIKLIIKSIHDALSKPDKESTDKELEKMLYILQDILES